MKSMKWNVYGIKVAKHGIMNISIVEVAKTLCALYARENCVGFMIILGKDERLKFDTDRDNYSKEVQRIYDETKTYHDGKWLMFEPTDTTLFDDFVKLLRIKRKPNRK
nr:DUF3788 family protein [Clostridioides difficile]